MADKQISDLVAATSVQTSDLFVLEQSGTAKKLTGQILINFLTAIADGHGGIAAITWTTSGTSGDGQDQHGSAVVCVPAARADIHDLAQQGEQERIPAGLQRVFCGDGRPQAGRMPDQDGHKMTL